MSHQKSSPKLAIVTMVRNECDIIELFLRINLRHAAAIFVTDHRSDDGTAEIIKRLQDEGCPLTYTYQADSVFRQSATITSMVREIARTDAFDYILPLDADEFLASENPAVSVGAAIAATIDVDQTGLIPWKTYCPISTRYLEANAPLHDNFRPRRSEPGPFAKVVIGREFAKACFIEEGNHFAIHERLDSTPRRLPLVLQHVPVRSAAQIIRKAILGSHTMALKAERGEGEAVHWDIMAEFIRARNFQITDQDLTELALQYSAVPGMRHDTDINMDGPRIGAAGDMIKFKDLAGINVAAGFDSYIAQLVAKLKST